MEYRLVYREPLLLGARGENGGQPTGCLHKTAELDAISLLQPPVGFGRWSYVGLLQENHRVPLPLFLKGGEYLAPVETYPAAAHIEGYHSKGPHCWGRARSVVRLGVVFTVRNVGHGAHQPFCHPPKYVQGIL